MKITLISTGNNTDKGPLVLSKFLQKNKHRTKVLFFSRSSKEEIKEMSRDSSLIIISANERTAHKASEAISFLKSLQKPIAYAGIFAQHSPEECIKETDLVVVRSPKETILELANRLENFQKISDIPGLWFKATEEVIKN